VRPVCIDLGREYGPATGAHLVGAPLPLSWFSFRKMGNLPIGVSITGEARPITQNRLTYAVQHLNHTNEPDERFSSGTILRGQT
jgi:hypothetical protein